MISAAPIAPSSEASPPGIGGPPRPVIWKRNDIPCLESSRLRQSRDGWALEGTVVLSHEGAPCRLDYCIRCDDRWMTRDAMVEGWIGNREFHLEIVRAPNGEWAMNGERQSAVSGCEDIDLNFSPSTNLLPIRRLALASGASASVRAAWLRFPQLDLLPLAQSYTRIGPGRYRYAAGSFNGELTVDNEGQVIDYAEWSRIT